MSETIETIECPHCNSKIWVNKLKYTDGRCDQCGEQAIEGKELEEAKAKAVG